MKNYIVFASTPAVAEVTVSGENEADAINKVKAMIDAGEEIGFGADCWDSGDVEFSALELNSEKGEDTTKQVLKPYTVILEATSRKEVSVKAITPEAAEELARQMYFNSDVLDFSDEVVERVVATVTTEDDDDDEDVLIGLLYAIFGDEEKKNGKPHVAS